MCIRDRNNFIYWRNKINTSEKNINRKNYSYHQWREGEKIKSKYIKNKDVEKLSNKISRRKELMEAVSLAKKDDKEYKLK